MRHRGQTSVPSRLRPTPAAAAIRLLCCLCCLLAPTPVRGDRQIGEGPPRPAASPGRGQQPRPHQSDERSPQEERQVVRGPIPDLALLDQDGRKIHFYRDLVKGKVVVINFVYTTCTAICPMMGKRFSDVRNLAGDRAGKNFHLISVTTDPETDTPERLRTWGAKFDAGPGWTLVTGGKSEIDQLLRALLGESVGKGVHTPIVLVGNDTRGTWTSASGLTSPSNLMKLIDAATSN